MADARYTAERIGAVLARRSFDGMLCIVDRCTRLGAECDLLVVTPNLRAIDVETVVDIARLASLRMWDAYRALDVARDERDRALAGGAA